MKFMQGAVALAMVLAAALPAEASGQDPTRQRADSVLRAAELSVTGPPGSALSDPSLVRPTRPVVISPLLDTPVSRAEYRLGPGDILDLSTFGAVTLQYLLAVSPEGMLVVPRLGTVPVLGLSLDDAEARVRALLGSYYRNLEVRLSLETVRSFKVFVLGDVPEPGARVASANTRVAELLPHEDSLMRARRNVVVRRASGDSLVVDLARFRQAGDLGQNPLLREGDVVLVPVTDETISVFGRVAFPGTYQYRRGETLAELFATVSGTTGFLASAADTVHLTRFVDDERREYHSLSRAEVLGPRGQQLLLQPYDAVYVPGRSNFREQRVATVVGQVQNPGTYPVEPGRTTVRDLVTMAGGFTEDASLVEASLRRSTGSSSDILRRLQGVPPESLVPEEQTILRVMSVDGPENVVIDFGRLYEAGAEAETQVIEAGDVLSVPRRRDQVIVLGAVREPGIVPYTPGMRPQAFVERAGDFASNADKRRVTIVKARSGARVRWRDGEQVDPGDRIIVPFEEHRTFLQRVQTVQGILGTVSGIILTIVGLRQIL